MHYPGLKMGCSYLIIHLALVELSGIVRVLIYLNILLGEKKNELKSIIV